MQYIQIDGTFTYAQNIKELKIGDISYINDNIGLHRILNNKMKYAYSLHLYSPALDESKIKNSYITKPSLPSNWCFTNV